MSEAITRSAIERKESRGGHFREDYPDKDREFATFNIVVRQGPDGCDGGPRVPIPEMPAELKQIIEETEIRRSEAPTTAATLLETPLGRV